MERIFLRYFGRSLRVSSVFAAALCASSGCSDASSSGSEVPSGSGGAASASATGSSASAGVGGGPSSSAGTGGSQPAATHAGLVSIQDVSIANFAAAGHGLTVTSLFNPARAPIFEETPGALTGCRGWSYDVETNPPPILEDDGILNVSGLTGGPIACKFDPQRGYICPTAGGDAPIEVAAAQGPTAVYSVAGAGFSSADVGRYFSASGAATGPNNGAFAIVGVLSKTEVVVANESAKAEKFPAKYAVLAGVGPTPNDLYKPFPDGAGITIGLTAGGNKAFDAFEVTLKPGDPFTLDAASAVTIKSIPVDGKAITLACATCGMADLTIVRITTTDADLTGLSPAAMPPPKKNLVEIQCPVVGATSITVPEGAMELLEKAHQASPITRIRTAFMRDGLKILTNAAPSPPSKVIVTLGRGVLGFTQP